jgi:mycofactocin biosynthetic radical S-adenosylmethionine protein MftC
VLIDAARRGLCAPVNLTWEITLKCNLHCRHCLSGAGLSHPRELTTAECRTVLDELAAIKVFQINVGGGEPFARSDFFEILEYAHHKGIVACISTNGTLLTRDICRRLAALEGIFLQVSLDGVDPATNDRIRGEGTYKRAMQGMTHLCAEGAAFSINTVLTRYSFGQLEALKALAAQFKASLRVSRFRPSGRAKESWQELAPSKEQLESFATWLQQDPEVLTGDSFFSLTSERRRRLGLDLCGAAKMTCCLAPDGTLYPCAFLQEPQFEAGQIRHQSLYRIWHDSEVFRNFRELEVRSCHFCHRFDSCRGGCPAVAYHIHRDLSQPDPECLMQCLGEKVRTAV